MGLEKNHTQQRNISVETVYSGLRERLTVPLQEKERKSEEVGREREEPSSLSLARTG